MAFSVEGRLSDFGGEPAVVSWRSPPERERDGWPDFMRGLAGDMLPIVLVLSLEERGASVNATPTGPAVPVDLDDARSAGLAIGSLLEPGYTVSGDLPPRLSYPLEPGDEA